VNLKLVSHEEMKHTILDEDGPTTISIIGTNHLAISILAMLNDYKRISDRFRELIRILDGAEGLGSSIRELTKLVDTTLDGLLADVGDEPDERGDTRESLREECGRLKARALAAEQILKENRK
jgi:hypothetical protein